MLQRMDVPTFGQWILTQTDPRWWTLLSLQRWMFLLGTTLQPACCLWSPCIWKPLFMIHSTSFFSDVTYQGARIFWNHRQTCLIICFLVNNTRSPVKLIFIFHLLDKLYRLWSINNIFHLNSLAAGSAVVCLLKQICLAKCYLCFFNESVVFA